MAPATASAEVMPYGADERQLTHVETEAVSSEALAVMERVTIDSQIATAKRYPRSISLFITRAQTMACIDEETAKSCFYRRPVGQEGGRQVYAEGESIRLAEIVAASYGNLAIRALIVEITPRYVKAVGMARDLEVNYMAGAECVESTVDKHGQPYSERQRLLIAKVAQSKAYRDAIFRVVPKALCKPIAIAASEVALGKGLTLEQRRERVMGWILSLNISPERVWKALGISGQEEMGTAEMLTLTGIRSAIRDGDTNVDEAFPADQSEQAKPAGGNAGVRELLKNGKRHPDPSQVKPTGPTTSAQAEPPTGSKQESQPADPTTTTSETTGKEQTHGSTSGGETRQTETRTTATEKPPVPNGKLLYRCRDNDCGATFAEPRKILKGKKAGTLLCPQCASENIEPVSEPVSEPEAAPPEVDAAQALDEGIAQMERQAQKPAEPPVRWRCLNDKCKAEIADAEAPKACSQCGSRLGWKDLRK